MRLDGFLQVQRGLGLGNELGEIQNKIEKKLHGLMMKTCSEMSMVITALNI